MLNRDKRYTPPRRGARTSSAGAAALARADAVKREERRFGDTAASPVPYDEDELGSGRGITYEWEYWVQQLQQQIDAIASGGGGSGAAAAFVHTQSTPAATWIITHPLATKPNVLVIDGSGHELHPEITYSGNTTVTVTHATPYSGTAYLRA